MLRGGYSFSKKSVKDLTRLAFSKADNDKKSFFKVIIYRETQMAWISIISLFLLVSWSRDQSNYTHIFPSKTQYLALMLQRHKKTSAFRLIYNIIRHKGTTCFSFSFCYRDINQDRVSNYSKITFWWLALVFNITNNLLRKSYVHFGKFIYLQKNEIIERKYLEQQLNVPKNSCSKKLREVSFF